MLMVQEPWKFPMKKVVHADGLEKATRDGWELIAVINASAVHDAQLYGQVTIPGQNGYGSTSHNASVSMPHSVVVPQYLVGIDEDSSIARAAKDREEALAKAAAATKKLEEAEPARVRTADQLHALAVDLEYAKRGGETLRTQRDELSARARKLEGDLAKVGREIGDAKMREIIERAEAAK